MLDPREEVSRTSHVGNALGWRCIMLSLGCKLQGTLPFQPVNFRNVRPHRTRRGCRLWRWGHGRARQFLRVEIIDALGMGCWQIAPVGLRVACGCSRCCRHGNQNDRREGCCFENCHRQFLPTTDVEISPLPWARRRQIQNLVLNSARLSTCEVQPYRRRSQSGRLLLRSEVVETPARQDLFSRDVFELEKLAVNQAVPCSIEPVAAVPARGS